MFFVDNVIEQLFWKQTSFSSCFPFCYNYYGDPGSDFTGGGMTGNTEPGSGISTFIPGRLRMEMYESNVGNKREPGIRYHGL